MTDILDLLVKLFGVVGAGSTLWFLFRKAPLEKRATEVEVQGDLLDQFNKQADRAVVEADKLRTEKEMVYQLTLENRQLKLDLARDAEDKAKAITETERLQQVNADQAKTIDKLVVSFDGMPTVIAQLMRQTVTDNAFKEVLQQALIAAGVALKDQPVEKPKEPLKELDKEAVEAVQKAQADTPTDPTALHSGDTVTVTVAPETPKT